MFVMLNDCADYGKWLFISYQHDHVVRFKWWENASNLNDRVDHGKRSCCQYDHVVRFKWWKDISNLNHRIDKDKLINDCVDHLK